MGRRRGRTELHYWERLVLLVFGLSVMGIDSDADWVLAFRIIGALIAAAAIGLVELAMALWYRARRSLQ